MVFYQQQQQQPELTEGFAPIEVEFKGLNPDQWIHMAVVQCLQAQVIDPMKYCLAVENLQSVVLRDEDAADRFDKEVNAKFAALERELGPIHKDQIAIELARWKFRKMLGKIEQARHKGVEYIE
jgi:hypothetical protein